MILGLSGHAGSGKDTMADHLVEKYNFTKVSLADPLKRICKEVYDFTDEQLWGPSSNRNKPDTRYSKGKAWVCALCFDLFFPDGHEVDTIRNTWKMPCYYCDRKDESAHSMSVYLTPRMALQTLGTEWGRDCYENTWLQYALRVAEQVDRGVTYDQKKGLVYDAAGAGKHVVIPDIRFRNEVDAVRKVGRVLRLRRQGVDGKVAGGVQGHASEAEQDEVPDSAFDGVLVIPEGIPFFKIAIDVYFHREVRHP